MALGGCGGGAADPGGGGDPTVAAAALVEGIVLDVDGESAAAGGVSLVIPETGAVAVTSPQGAFAFPSAPLGDWTLAVTDPTSGARRKGGADDPAGDDSGGGSGSDDPPGDDSGGSAGSDDPAGHDAGDDDGQDRTDDGVRFRGVDAGEHVRIELRIENGRIVDARVTRSRDGGNDACPHREIEIEMQRTEANPDPDMDGEVELEADCEHQQLEVEVEDATPGDVLVAVVVDPDENEYSLGERTVEADGDAEWRLDTRDGDLLPFDVDSLRALEKHRVVVRDADGTPLLLARIPELSMDGGDGTCVLLRGRARLVPEVPGVEGHVDVRVRGCEDTGFRQVFRIEAEHLDRGQEVEFFLEDPDAPGSLVSIGTVMANAEGEAQVEFDTGEGDALPLGVSSVRELLGQRVRVNDDVTGDVLLVGKVPELVDDL